MKIIFVTVAVLVITMNWGVAQGRTCSFTCSVPS